MPDLAPLGRVLIALGLLLVAVGLAVTFAGKIPWLGKLPGDVSYEGKNVKFYFPLATSLLLSALLTAILWIVSAIRRH